MSPGSFGFETGAMSKAESVAWLQCGLLLLASACLGWLWWSSWPDTATLHRNTAVVGNWPTWIMIALYVGFEKIKRRQLGEPMEDERDRAINGEAHTSGFAALGLLVLMLSSIVRLDGWRNQVTPEWVSLALLSMLVLALTVDAGHRLVRYRWG